MEFIHDDCVGGQRFRRLMMAGEVIGECPRIEIDTSLPAARVVGVLEQVAASRGLLRRLGLDHRPEISSRVLNICDYLCDVRPAYFRPGKPLGNAYVDSCHSHSRFRDECLVTNWFLTPRTLASRSSSGAGNSTGRGRTRVSAGGSQQSSRER